jgi:hypothetical protein
MSASTAFIEARLRRGGIDGNARLTSVNGAILIVLLAVEGVTIVFIGQLITLHLFLGMLLLGPIALKLASTGYRFISYYGGRPAYRRKGPPPLALRVLAPGVVISTLLVAGTGVALLLAGPSSRSSLLPIHKLSFFAWIALTGVHVLGRLQTSLVSLRAEYAPGAARAPLAGRGIRLFALVGAVIAGAALALLLIPDFAAWQHASFHRRG